MKKPVQETRQLLLDVTRGLMTHKGYSAVGLAEIVAAAGVPKGSFYYYFKSKEEFGMALLEEYFSSYLATVDGLLTSKGTGAKRLMKYFKYWADTQGTELLDDKCLVVKLGPEVCDLSDDMRVALRHGTDAIIGRIRACVVIGQSDGSVTAAIPADELAESLYQLWLGASLLAKLNKSTASFSIALTTTRHMLA